MKKPKTEDQFNGSGQKQTKKPKKFFLHTIFRDWCKACGICCAFCPRQVIEFDANGEPSIVRPDDCIGCRFCELHCPDFAITIIERNGKKRGNEA